MPEPEEIPWAEPAEKDEALGFLEEAEAAFRRMIVGIFRFIFVRLPAWIYELFNDLFDWLERFFRYAVKFSIRLIRTLFFAGVWALLVFGPLSAALCWTAIGSQVPRILGFAWTAISLIGSVWGVNRWWQQRNARLAASASSAPQKSMLRTDVPVGLLVLLSLLGIYLVILGLRLAFP